MAKRFGLPLIGLSICLMSLTSCQQASVSASDEYLIKNALVYDGSGGEGISADVLVRGNEIAFVGEAGGQFPGTKIVDAKGLVVAPGFIDPHTHAESDLESEDAAARQNHAYAFQGVTTVMVGNDGHGNVDVANHAEKAEQDGIGTNVAYMAGFGHIRKAVLGEENREPSADELQTMKSHVTKAMCEGAYGLSAGLYYTPQNFAKTDEVVALAKIVGEFGGYYDTHMRDESTYNIGVKGALREAIDIGKQSGASVHISHIKALGPAVWGQSADMIKIVEDAKKSGQIVTADQYPWAASGTRISNALAPRWSLDGGLTGLRKRLEDTKLRAKIRAEMAGNLKRRGGADRLLITGNLEGSDWEVGQNLEQIAVSLKLDPLDAALKILETGDARVASFNMDPDDIAAFAAQDWVVTGSDGSTGHPRKYASFPKAYKDLVQDKKTLSLGRFIQRSSSQVAELIGIKDRGYIRKGMIADIVILDPDKYAPRANYEQPTLLSKGVQYLFVNGQPVISNGKATGMMPGRAIRQTENAKNPICAGLNEKE